MLRAVELTHHYDLDPLFEDLDLSLSPGDRVGLVGPNGTGKSTLMRLLAGIERPVRGRVVRSADLRVAATWIADPQTRPPLQVRVPQAADGDGEALLVEHEGVEVRAGGRLLLGPMPLRLQRGERVLITGENGAGKTSLLRTVIPMLPGVRLLPQTHVGLPANLTTLEFFRSRVAVYADEAERVLEVALRAYRGTMLVVSHDEELADRIGLTSRWHLAGGRLESAA